MRLYLISHRRLGAYAFWLSFVVIGIAVGFLRNPPAYAPDAAEVIAVDADIRGIMTEAVSQASPEGTLGESASAQKVALVSYTVESGDTLSSIAQRFNTSSDSIAYINGISSPNRLSVGKELSVMQNASGVVVKVVSGDNVVDIAQRYGITALDIVKANDLYNASDISVGQVLILPGAKVTRSTQALSRSSNFAWPIKGIITSAFGMRIHPVSGESSSHDGLDISGNAGSNVYAAGSGVITFLDWSGDYGRLIVIDHGGGTETKYAHLSGFEAALGDRVYAGDLIGYVGSSGNTTGPHLHFEVRRNGTPVNPRNYLP